MIVGYDPHRVVALTHRCHEALGALDSIAWNDPATGEAQAAVRSLHRSIEVGVLAAAQGILRHAPLTRSFGAVGPADVPLRRRDRRSAGASVSPTGGGTIADFFHELRLRQLAIDLGLSEMSEEELLAWIGEDLTASLTSTALVDLDDPRSADIRRAAATELRRRFDADPSFLADLLVAARRNPLVAFTAMHASWSPATQVALLDAGLAEDPGEAEVEHVRIALIELAMPRLTGDAETALLAVSTPTLMTKLVALGEWLEVDPASIASLVDGAFAAPGITDLDARGEETAALLASLTTLMNSRAGDRGLDARVSLAITLGITPLLPHVIGAFDGHQAFFLKRHDGSVIPVRIASDDGDVLDLFGGLMRSPESLEVLLSTLPVLASGIRLDTERPPLYTADELVGFAVVLGEATANEQSEEELRAQRREQEWIAVLDLVEAALGTAKELGSEIGETAVAGATLGIDAARWLVGELIAPDGLGLDDVPAVTETLLTIGIAAQIARAWSSDDEAADELNGSIDSAYDLLDRGASFDEVEAAAVEVRDEVEHLLHATDEENRRRLEELWASLDHPGLDLPPFQPDADPDLDG